MKTRVRPVLFLLIPVLSLAGDTLNLNLADAIAMSLKNNKTVLSARALVAEKRAEVGVARALFLPSLDLQGTYTRLGKIQGFEMAVPQYMMLPLMVYDLQTGQPIGYTDSIPMAVGADTVELEMGKRDNYLLRGSLTQSLFTGGKILNGYKIAELTYEIEEQNYKKTENNIKFQVMETFYKTLTAQSGVKLIKESYDQMQRHVRQVEKLYENGYVSRLDLLRTLVGLSNLRTKLIRAENGYKLALDGMKLLLGVEIEKAINLEGSLEFQPYEIDLEYATETALKKRPEIQILRKTKAISNKALNIERANFSPNVFAALNYDYKKPVGFSTDEWGTDWNVTVGFTMPIFSGFSRLKKIDKRKAQVKQIKFTLTQLEDGIKIEVKNAYLSLTQEEEILKYQDENVAQAEEALRLAEERYKNGFITNLEYMDTELALLQAKTEYLSSLSNYLVSRAGLEKAMGE